MGAHPEIDRAALNEVLSSALEPGTICWGHDFQQLESSGPACTLRFKGSLDQRADVVVGASGGSSRVQPYVTGTQPEFTGTMMIGAIVKQADLSRC